MNIWATVGLLAVAVLAPTACVVWLIQKVSLSERAEIDRLLVASKEATLANAEQNIKAELQGWFDSVDGLPPSEAFHALCSDGFAGAYIRVDDDANILYPKKPFPRIDRISVADSEEKDLLKTLREEARSLSPEDLLSRTLEAIETSQHAYAMEDGRSAGPWIVLLGLGHATPQSDAYETLLSHLREMGADYAKWPMPSSQRRFIQSRFLQERPDGRIQALRAAELLSEQWSESIAARKRISSESTVIIEDGKAVIFNAQARSAIILQSEDFQERMASVLNGMESIGAMRLANRSAEPEADVIGRPLSGVLTGWTLTLKSATPTAGSRWNKRSYLYASASALILLLSGTTAVVLAGLIRRQMTLAQLKNDLVSTVSHELKTPVASIRLLVDTLRESEELDPNQTREYLDLVSRENIRLGHLIENFLSFSRMERGKNAFQRESVPVEEIATGAVNAFKERFSNDDFEIELQQEAGIPAVLADSEAMQTALGNLLENAYKYGGSPRRIGVAVARGPRAAIFSVSDNGKGIPKREQARIFDRFYQGGDRKLSGHSGGVGLGLSIVSFIVSNHEGEIQLQSSPDNGSVFSIEIPYA